MKTFYNIEQLLANDSKSPVFTILANSYYKQGYYKEALNVCQKGLDENPDNQLGQYVLAKLYLIYKEEKKAEKILKKIVQNNPHHFNATILLIEILIILNRSKTTINKYVVFANLVFPNNETIKKYLQLYNNKNINQQSDSKKILNINKKEKKLNQSSGYNSQLATKTMYGLFLKQKKYLQAMEILIIMKKEDKYNKFSMLEIKKLNKIIQKES